ncbi:PAS domain-containing protein [Marinilabilia rubra]|uniref:Histidine kinase n=1 Tax=Marinilabilia rubra TaxID=2162893 RepID=A0A2U2B7M1_9BACT|nr:PAS domain-containing protein [Marinilabilia rubra]PWD99081.1 histidine kinase [Marinilabilia rubra]
MGRINILKTKEIKQAISDSPRKAQDIIDAESVLGICVTDERGYYTYVNDRYNEIYKYTPGELVGKHFTDVVPPELRQRLQTAHDMFIKNEYEIVRYWDVLNKLGEKIKIQAAAAFFDNIFNNKGKGHKVTFVYYDENA